MHFERSRRIESGVHCVTQQVAGGRSRDVKVAIDCELAGVRTKITFSITARLFEPGAFLAPLAALGSALRFVAAKRIAVIVYDG